MTSEPDLTNPAAGTAGELHQATQALLSDYCEGQLSAGESKRVEEHLASCVACRGAHQELRETITALLGLHKQPAPVDLAAAVTDTIRRRSGGRFFGRRVFGDRVPFTLLAVIALVVAICLYLVLRSSDTGSLRYQREPDQPTIAPGATEAVPRP